MKQFWTRNTLLSSPKTFFPNRILRFSALVCFSSPGSIENWNLRFSLCTQKNKIILFIFLWCKIVRKAIALIRLDFLECIFTEVVWYMLCTVGGILNYPFVPTIFCLTKRPSLNQCSHRRDTFYFISYKKWKHPYFYISLHISKLLSKSEKKYSTFEMNRSDLKYSFPNLREEAIFT